MSEIFERKLSLLMDGEITPFETKRLADEMYSNENFKSLWLRMNKHRAAMHGELLDPNLDLSQNIMSQINNLPSSETNNINKWPNLNFFSLNYMKVCCYLIGFFFILSLPRTARVHFFVGGARPLFLGAQSSTTTKNY